MSVSHFAVASASVPARAISMTGFSLSHFKPLFRRASGMPLRRFVLERRVERVRVRLMEGGRSRTEIAMEAGFTHPSHMARSMRRVLGLTPAQIADRCQRTEV
ncbi:MAG TPA: AraC family transcriptional regulator [Steroidobacteraceae bacterium]|nr:AraC family transcriptional regulator [Steroidobacteraceae bacterium]